MYAVAPHSLIYHLVKDHRTLCGLFVVGDLRAVTQKPKDRLLCLRCEHAAPNLEYKELTKEKAA